MVIVTHPAVVPINFYFDVYRNIFLSYFHNLLDSECWHNKLSLLFNTQLINFLMHDLIFSIIINVTVANSGDGGSCPSLNVVNISKC